MGALDGMLDERGGRLRLSPHQAASPPVQPGVAQQDPGQTQVLHPAAHLPAERPHEHLVVPLRRPHLLDDLRASRPHAHSGLGSLAAPHCAC